MEISHIGYLHYQSYSSCNSSVHYTSMVGTFAISPSLFNALVYHYILFFYFHILLIYYYMYQETNSTNFNLIAIEQDAKLDIFLYYLIQMCYSITTFNTFLSQLYQMVVSYYHYQNFIVVWRHLISTYVSSLYIAPICIFIVDLDPFLLNQC